jgi:hypothetical protein
MVGFIRPGEVIERTAGECCAPSETPHCLSCVSVYVAQYATDKVPRNPSIGRDELASDLDSDLQKPTPSSYAF